MSSDSSIYYPPWCSQLLTLSPCSLIFWRFLLLTQCHILQHHFITILGEVCRSEPAAAAESLHSCPTLCDPIDDSPPVSPVPGILQARTLEWVAISFNGGKWKVRWSRSVVSDPQRSHGLQPSRLLHPCDFPGKSTGVGCCCLYMQNTYTPSFES